MLIGAGLRVGFQEMMQHMQQHHNVLFVLALLCLSCCRTRRCDRDRWSRRAAGARTEGVMRRSLRNWGKPELRCNPSPSYESMRRMMDARVKPA
jgi:hypothetical protein